jgi:hypothetical protein
MSTQFSCDFPGCTKLASEENGFFLFSNDTWRLLIGIFVPLFGFLLAIDYRHDFCQEHYDLMSSIMRRPR